MRYLALLNKDGGTLKTADLPTLESELRASFESAGHSLDIEFITGGQLEKSIQEFLNDGEKDALIIGGGDGTVSAASSALASTEKVLAVLPAGTMNLFARSLSIPLDLSDAIDSLASGERDQVDVASVNGRIFVHHFSVGLHPKAMRLRNKSDYSSRYGKILASLRAMVTVISSPPVFDVTFRKDEASAEPFRLSAISVTNNNFDDAHLPYADTLTQGQLWVYFADKLSPSKAVRLVVDIFIGGWLSNPTVSQHTATKLSFDFPSLWRKAKASIDGEIIDLEKSIKIEIHPKSLNVVVPNKAGNNS